MPGRQRPKHKDRPVSLLILEGYTEVEFYGKVRDVYLAGIRVELRNMKGQGNTNKDVLAELFKYCRDNPGDKIRVYCCIDSERDKLSATPLDLDLIKNKTKTNRNMKNVLSVNAILADPEIESWFFYDIEGIYKFLRTKGSDRKPKNFRVASNFGKRDLQKLFHASTREYLPGRRARNFINKLDVDKIIDKCTDLANGIKLIKIKSEDTTNELSP